MKKKQWERFIQFEVVDIVEECPLSLLAKTLNSKDLLSAAGFSSFVYVLLTIKNWEGRRSGRNKAWNCNKSLYLILYECLFSSTSVIDILVKNTSIVKAWHVFRQRVLMLGQTFFRINNISDLLQGCAFSLHTLKLISPRYKYYEIYNTKSPSPTSFQCQITSKIPSFKWHINFISEHGFIFLPTWRHNSIILQSQWK